MNTSGFLVFTIFMAAVVVALYFGVKWVRKPETRLRGVLILLLIILPTLASAAVAVLRAVYWYRAV